MGTLAINLVAEPHSPAAAAAQQPAQQGQQLSPLGAALAGALGALAPRCLALPLSVGALNARPWWPRRDQNNQRLVGGPLQMAANTQVAPLGWLLACCCRRWHAQPRAVERTPSDATKGGSLAKGFQPAWWPPRLQRPAAVTSQLLPGRLLSEACRCLIPRWLQVVLDETVMAAGTLSEVGLRNLGVSGGAAVLRYPMARLCHVFFSVLCSFSLLVLVGRDPAAHHGARLRAPGPHAAAAPGPA